MSGNFIKTLNNDEKIVFFKIFCKMIKSDGTIADMEIAFLKGMARRYGLDNDTIVDIIHHIADVDYMHEAQKITNRKHALQLIKELCFLSNIDTEMADEELDIIVNVADAMNIEEDKVVQINRWVLNNLVLAKAGRIILEEDND